MKFRKGDIVGRISYGKDIVFVINRIIKCQNEDVAILKGLITRIEADSPLDDLELIENSKVAEILEKFDREIKSRKKNLQKKQNCGLKRNRELYGKILHLDGDKQYSEKSHDFYKSMGLNVIVKNISENKQPKMIEMLLNKYNPDVLVITGHDGMIKKGDNYNDIYNYRNSRYFVETVIRARRWEQGANRMAIFAGACQSYYEAIMEAGANFASSPARILIDFKDPLIVAEKIAITDANKYVTINDIKDELRDGENGVSGIGSRGKKIVS